MTFADVCIVITDQNLFIPGVRLDEPMDYLTKFGRNRSKEAVCKY